MTTQEEDELICENVMIMLSDLHAKIISKSDKMSEEMTKNNYTTVIAEIPNLPWRKKPEYAMFLLFSRKSEVSASTLNKLAEKMIHDAKSQAGDRIVNVTFIVNEDDEPNLFSELRIRHPKSILNFYLSDHFLVNIKENHIYPKHEIADPSDVEQFMRLYREDPLSLVVMKINDAACEWLGARVGDYMRIERRSDTIGIEVMFRRCVERNYSP